MPRHFGSVFRPNKSISTGENFFAPDSTLLPDDYLARHAVHKHRFGLRVRARLSKSNHSSKGVDGTAPHLARQLDASVRNGGADGRVQPMAATPTRNSSPGDADCRIEFAEFRLQLLRLIERVRKPQDAVAELFGQIQSAHHRSRPKGSRGFKSPSLRQRVCSFPRVHDHSHLDGSSDRALVDRVRMRRGL
jgi:hypothetical protein